MKPTWPKFWIPVKPTFSCRPVAKTTKIPAMIPTEVQNSMSVNASKVSAVWNS